MQETLNNIEPTCPDLSLDFTIKIPPSVNHMYIQTKGGSKILTKDAKEYIKHTQNVVKKKMREIGYSVEEPGVWHYMDLYFYFPDKRIRDSHNCIKILMDSLEGLLFMNDYYIMPRIQDVQLDRDNPRLEVIYKPKGEADGKKPRYQS